MCRPGGVGPATSVRSRYRLMLPVVIQTLVKYKTPEKQSKIMGKICLCPPSAKPLLFLWLSNFCPSSAPIVNSVNTQGADIYKTTLSIGLEIHLPTGVQVSTIANLLQSHSYSIPFPHTILSGKGQNPRFLQTWLIQTELFLEQQPDKKEESDYVSRNLFCTFPPGAATENSINLHFHFISMFIIF